MASDRTGAGPLAGSRAGRRAGFTLLEVLVAVAILGTAVVAAMSAYGAELRSMGRAREVSTAVAVARERLATIELLGSDDLPSLPDSLEGGELGGGLEGYRWTADAEPVRGRQLARITVTVTWPGGERRLTTVVRLPTSRVGVGP